MNFLVIRLTSMERSVHILHLNSLASEQSSSDAKSASDFTVKLPETISLSPVGDWFCSLKQCYLGFSWSYPLFVCCDLCEESVGGERKLPILRVIHKKEATVYDDGLSIPIIKRDIDRVRIYFLKTIDYQPPNYRVERARMQAPTHVTLELKRGLSSQ